MNIIRCENDLPAEFSAGAQAVAIDTEAMGLCPHRDRLCLAQFTKGDGDVYLVQFNVFSKAANICKLLTSDNLKIFHFARFDVMMLFKYLGAMTRNIFCTKIASRLVRTYTEQHSLRALCHAMLGVNISKNETCTDWGRADLTDAQLKYAATDVLYLHELKEKLEALLQRENRLELAQACFDYLPTRIKFDLMLGPDYDIFQH